MPLNKNINKVLLIGSGPIIISQGCEFDYSGTQACKALKEMGCKVILINPNPATIMTDPELADITYIEPINIHILEEIIKKERPDALLPTMGGQTALNAALELEESGILSMYKVKLIGVNIQTIRLTEDRQLFRDILKELELWCPRSLYLCAPFNISEIEKQLDYPIIIRTSYTLGGSGSGIASNREQLNILLDSLRSQNPDNLVFFEEALIGWKEYELEVMVDSAHNFIVVCPIENLDPLGVHTGDSITVAPILTLTDKEYQKMRSTARILLKRLGITSGGCNVQFAVHPQDGRMVVIEVNPRVSRSSALASKATGFPIAKIATKVALGYTLSELSNEMTDASISASFEPSIDYVVVKIPRFNFDKFPGTNNTLTTQMKAIGETMGIGRTFQEALQKALRSTETGADGLSPIKLSTNNKKEIEELFANNLSRPNENRIFYLAEAFRRGWSIEKVFQLTYIDPWFLNQIKGLIDIENDLKEATLTSLTHEQLTILKKKGFSDGQIGKILGVSEQEIHHLRKQFSLYPVYKHIDSCAAEFPSKTSYMYSSYDSECESSPTNNPKIIILGSGPNRIGQGIEFDYSCVHAALAVRELGYEAIMVNNNPETVSTDYDCSDRLYVEPLTPESLLEIIRIENPCGLLSQFGGQTSLVLGQKLADHHIKIFGTQPQDTQVSEDRVRFKDILNKIGLKQPPNKTVDYIESALEFASFVGYPLIVRPSFVIGGNGFSKINQETELISYFSHYHFSGNPTLLEKFMDSSLEIDMDAISDGKDFIICGILEQIEAAGIHSGDSTCINPAFLSKKVKDELIEYTYKLSKALHVKGFINIQFLIQGGEVFVLEANLRASRTIPFLCKSSGIPFVKIATRVVLGEALNAQDCPFLSIPTLISVKQPIFSCHKFPESQTILGVEMKSTGEIMTVGRTREEALNKLKMKKEMPPELLQIYPLQGIISGHK